MQKKIGITILAALLTVGIAAMATAGEEAWMDMAGCDMCKHLSADAELLENMTWNHYDVKEGIMSVCTVTKDKADSYARACSMMDETMAKMMAGEKTKLCNMCTDLGGIMMTNVSAEKVNTDFGDISLMTSKDEATVKRLHAWAERTRTEMAKMHEGTKAE